MSPGGHLIESHFPTAAIGYGLLLRMWSSRDWHRWKEQLSTTVLARSNWYWRAGSRIDPITQRLADFEGVDTMEARSRGRGTYVDIMSTTHESGPQIAWWRPGRGVRSGNGGPLRALFPGTG